MSLKKGHRLKCDGVDYELLKAIGGGGSGDVWLADAKTGRWAIKFLKLGVNEKQVERFDREATFQAGANHDHIVRVVARGEHEGQPFYIMPRYPDTLRRVIDRGETDVKTLLSYVFQIGEAIQFAHQYGIVHRDVKPENVLVDGATAALADFGIAHFVNSALTSAGELVGNRDYRAPEQRKGRDARAIGPEADVYALGLILNECFTEEAPVGSSYRSIEASYPLMAYLDPVVSRMLAQSPSNRPTIADVLALTRFLEARKNDEIGDIEATLRLDDLARPDGAAQNDVPFRRASEDIWYAANLVMSKSPDELAQFNGNWHMGLGYDVDPFLKNLCVQSRLIDLCQRKFDYESNAYKRDHSYKPLDVGGDSNHQRLFSLALALVSEHPLPPEYDLSGRILKTFASCVDYHCAEILSDARQVVSDVNENLLGAPILWIFKYLALYAPNIKDVDHVADRIRIDWQRSATFNENEDDAELYLRAHPVLDPETVLEVFRETWDIAVTHVDEEWSSVLFRTPGEYGRFCEHAYGLAEPLSIFESDVRDLFRSAVLADGITQLTLSSGFDVCTTLAKTLGLRD